MSEQIPHTPPLVDAENIKDKKTFVLNDEQFERFEEALQNGRENPTLKAFLAAPTRWS